MAATEVRVAWHKTVNRCFVQEDAKSAPKLASCQSSYAASKSDDVGLTNAPDESSYNAVSRNYKAFSELIDMVAKHETMEIDKAFSEIIDMVAKRETMKIDSVGYLVSKKTKDFSLDSNYSWIEGENALPWWKTTDRDELACLVSKKSLNHVENCDLPPPRNKKYLTGQPCAKCSGFSNLTVQGKEYLDSELWHRKLRPRSNKGHLYFSSDTFSSDTTIQEGVSVIEQPFEGDYSKVQLMEALRHSQTRAREAEEIAKQAYAEKEHIIALFFIQASQLLTYKQWFQLMQLENLLNTEIKNKDKKKHDLCKAKSDVSTYAVAFALELSLVGAGLLLGWTAGWMLPGL